MVEFLQIASAGAFFIWLLAVFDPLGIGGRVLAVVVFAAVSVALVPRAPASLFLLAVLVPAYVVGRVSWMPELRRCRLQARIAALTGFCCYIAFPLVPTTLNDDRVGFALRGLLVGWFLIGALFRIGVARRPRQVAGQPIAPAAGSPEHVSVVA